MSKASELVEYCNVMKLDYILEDCGEIFTIDGKSYHIVDDERILFNNELTFLPDEELVEDTVGWVYAFGGRWYLQEGEGDVSLNELVYKGQAKQKLPPGSFLGVHSGYELLNGIGTFKEWVKKAKYLGVKTLGICEKNSLSGVLAFQNECGYGDIKPILGITLSVLEKGELVSEVKLYVKDLQGWANLLKFNTIINVDKKRGVEMSFLEDNLEGLFMVVDPKNTDFSKVSKKADFYQLETVTFLSPDKDTEFINNFEKFLKSDLEPISITDAYYLEKRDAITREILWDLSKAYDYRTDNQYFKSKDEYAAELINMFEGSQTTWVSLYKRAVANENFLTENCNFKYDTDTRHLPKYIMTEEESADFSTNEELFLYLIKLGFTKKGFNKKDTQVYIDRLKIEIGVLRQGDVIDYFLTLHDIVRYAKSESILTGIGRGSAGGSLVAYLLGIIKINPLDYELLFERFLNSGRMGLYEDRPLYKIELEDGVFIELAEGALVRILRGEKEITVYIHELVEGDKILKY
jgi:DNA polymerase-3 subunit alpha